MKYLKICVYSVLLHTFCISLSSHQSESCPILPTKIGEYIRNNDKKSLAQLLTNNPDLEISNDLIQLAYRKKQKSEINRCRNVGPLVISIAATIYSTALAVQPFSCRPLSNHRYLEDFGCLTSSGGTILSSLYYGNKIRKDLTRSFYFTDIIELLQTHQSKQKQPTTV